MKKVLSLIVLAGMFSFYACGPSAEEKAAAEKAKMDSIANAAKAEEAAHQAAIQDSIAKIQAMKDSIVKAEDAKANAKGKAGSSAPKTETKAAPAPTPAPAVKVGQKRPGSK